MSPTSNKQRQLSLEKMGGAKMLRTLPRETRALVLASLMQEAPAKPKSEKAAAFCAFSSAVEKMDPVRAKKIAEKYSLDGEKCKELVSAKVAELRGAEAEGNPRSRTASDFEILFGLSEDAKARFIDAMGQQLGVAYAKLGEDYAFAHVLFEDIINSETNLGVTAHTKDAATGLAISFMKRRNFNGAFGIMQKHLLEGGRIEGEQGRKLREEMKKMLLVCSENYSYEINAIASKNGGRPFLQQTILEMAPMGFKEPGSGEKILSLMLASGLESQAKVLGAYLARFYLGKADAKPDKFYADYPRAAHSAMLAGMMDEMDEALDKYFSMCEYLGEGGKPELLEEGMRAALAFSREDVARSLGKKAALHFLSIGEFGRAEEAARESGNRPLARYTAEMGARIRL